MWTINIEIIEQGDIYFFYKPKKGLKKVSKFDDVSRFYIVLAPHNKPIRFIVLGKKRLPKIDDGGKAGWAYVQKIGGRGFTTVNQEIRLSKGTSRPVGEGIYALISHGDHTHLVYELELPKTVKRVQKAFELRKKANYLITSKPIDVQVPSYSMIRHSRSRKGKSLSSRFMKTTTDLLDLEGSELLLIPVKSDFRSMGVASRQSEETEASAEIFNRLKVNKNRHPIGPLIRGQCE